MQIINTNKNFKKIQRKFLLKMGNMHNLYNPQQNHTKLSMLLSWLISLLLASYSKNIQSGGVLDVSAIRSLKQKILSIIWGIFFLNSTKILKTMLIRNWLKNKIEYSYIRCVVCVVAWFFAARDDKPVSFTRDEREVGNVPNAPPC